ncbi:MAG: NAD(P)-dependent oxidoreductase [Ignavibacteriae bacterium]|nr:NAD(P)-dependent oxidoreductase [Ignavibacteriota bacterium]MCB9217403.1 NAD(P)-dependent oxidoreductase [Ignavibacteria bacterium]
MTEQELDLLLSEPNERLGHTLSKLESPILILGANGKMGPTLSLLAKRSLELVGVEKKIVAISRFGDAEGRNWFEKHGIETQICDLLSRNEVNALPDSANILYMAGRKFGTQQQPSLTWSMNTLPPSYICERFTNARIVALSSGAVYPMVPVRGGGSTERDPLTPPGEYANACVARERMFEYYSEKQGTKIALIRLNYAVEPRYGVLVDIALKVYRREPVDLTMGYLNCIWQRDANDMILRSFDLASSPATPLNLTGLEIFSVRSLAEMFGKHFGHPPQFTGSESDHALLNNASATIQRLGEPEMSIEKMVRIVANWITTGGRLLGKPTHFEVRDGSY